MVVNAAERRRIAEIKSKWEQLKAGPDGLSASGYATAVALWASMNVDYLIALAEREVCRG